MNGDGRFPCGRSLRRGAAVAACAVLLALAAPGFGVPGAAADAAYQRFVKQFWSTARKAGISRATYEAAFDGLTPDPEVLEKNASQPEEVLTAAQYVTLTITDTRIAGGKAMLEKHADLLESLEKRYGVDKHVLLAVWGMETSYGERQGDRNVIRSLSTLAYTGPRRTFGRRQLLAALKILERGDIAPGRMTGSWAGAMGHTQFIPGTYNMFAVDADGDGRRDIWNTLADALGSTANFLARNGWRTGETWGYEVVLPGGFRKPGGRHSLAWWQRRGVKRPGGKPFPRPGDRADLWLPAGPSGPAFLRIPNFRVLMRYNVAEKYALAVGHLSDRLRGGGPFATAWPGGLRPLTEEERFELQLRLTAQGYPLGEIDGLLGPKTRAATREFQKANGLEADGFPTPKELELLRQAAQ